MKKSVLKVIVTLLAMAIVLMGCSTESAPPASNAQPGAGNAASAVVEMKMVNLVPENDPIHIGMVYLKEQLETKSNGQIKVIIYGNKSISNSNEEEAEMIRNDMAHFTTSPSYMMAALNKNLNKFYIYDMPYMFDGFDELWAFSDGEIGEALRKDLLDLTNIKGYPVVGNGLMKISSNSKPILTPADLKGLKIRTSSSQLHQAMVKAFGANPTPVAWGETYTAIQQKTVDGMMTSAVHYDAEKYYEVLSYMGAINTSTIPHMPIMSNTWYEGLSDELRVIVDECMADYMVYFRQLIKDTEDQTIKNLKEKGMTVSEYDGEAKQVWVDTCMPLWQSEAELVGGTDFVNEVVAWVEQYRGK